ncbi:MAG: flagellar basal body protein FliL, partial [Geminicoccaceae bacterium]|nr:flagellar basal body protein FliL [Geminicoccaceae bacterium]
MSEADASEKPKKGGRKLLLLVVVPLVLALGGGAAAFFLGLFPSSASGEAEAHQAEAEVVPEDDPSQAVFVDLPDILVNLNVSGRRLRFLKFVA